MSVRFPPAPGMDNAIAGLAARIHGHTEGRPLLMVSVADDLMAHGQLAGTPSGWVVNPTAAAQQLPVPKTSIASSKAASRSSTTPPIPFLKLPA